MIKKFIQTKLGTKLVKKNIFLQINVSQKNILGWLYLQKRL